MTYAKRGGSRPLLLLACLTVMATFLAIAANPARAATVAPTFNPTTLVDQPYTTTDTSGVDVNYTLPAASDDDGGVPVSCLPPLGHHFPIGESTVTCTATNNIGTTTAYLTLHVVPPAGEVYWVGTYSDIALEATGPTGAVATWPLLDVFGTPSAASCAQPSGSTFPIGITTVTCTAIGSTQSDVQTFNVTVKDTMPPSITVPGNITTEATGPTGATVSFAAATATDIADPNPTVGCDHNSGVTYPVGTTTVTCTATDSSGNSSSGTFTITVQDTTAPVVTVPAPITTEATGPSGAPVTYTTSASDTVDGSITPTCVPASGSTFALGITPVNCSATDTAGNIGSASFTVMVDDTTGPVFDPTSNVTQELIAGLNVLNYTQPGATDLVDGSRPVQCLPSVGTPVTAGPYTVTCKSWDTHGNMSQVSFTVTVQDTIAPVVTVPAPITAEATSSAGAVVNYTATATDSADGPLTPTCDTPSGSTFPLGVTTVHCTATDAGGNSTTDSFTVTVIHTTGPVFSNVPANFSIEQTNPSTFLLYTSPTATDAVDGVRPVVCSPPSGSALGPNIYTVSCFASDAHGNQSIVSFLVTIHDTTVPVLTLPTPIVAEATGPLGAAVPFTATAVDNIDGPLTVTCDHNSGDTFALGVTTVNCSATDHAGNVGSGSFTVTVLDTTAPSITVPADITAEAAGPSGAPVTFTPPSATDLVDGTDSVTCNHVTGDTFPIGTTTINCSSTDAAGNTGTASFTVTVQDTTGPVISGVPADITVTQSSNPSGTAVTYTLPTALDAVNGVTAVTCTPASGTLFAVGTTTVHCSSTDSSGNTTTESFHVTVVPPPTVTISSPVNGGVYGINQFALAGYTCAADPQTTLSTCHGDVADNSMIDTTTTGNHSFTVTATDALGGTTTKTVTYSVVSPPPPVTIKSVKSKPFRIVSARRSSHGRVYVTVQIPKPGKLDFIATHALARTSAAPLRPGHGRFSYVKRSITTRTSGRITTLLVSGNASAKLLGRFGRPVLRLTVRYTPHGSHHGKRLIKLIRPHRAHHHRR